MGSSAADPPTTGRPADPGFLTDLRSAVRVWRAHPYLPLVAMVLWALARVRFFPVQLVLALAWVSWPGVVRIWYLRAFSDKDLRPTELIGLWRAFFWRYVRLGLVLVVPAFILAVVVQLDAHPDRFTVIFVGWTFVADFALTFVTPALAYSTGRVGDAFGRGLRMIRDEWPRCALYLLAPPLAIETLFGLRRIAAVGVVTSFVLAMVAAALGVAFRGATAAFYLRRQPCGPDGAAWQDAAVPVTLPNLLPPPPVPIDGRPPKNVRRRRPNFD